MSSKTIYPYSGISRYLCMCVAGILFTGCVATDPPASSSSEVAVASSSAPVVQSSSVMSVAPSSSSIASSSSEPASSSSEMSSSSEASSSEESLISTRPDSGSKQINVGGRNRSYNIYVPNSYPTDRKVPLVLRFHGLGGNGGSEINTGYRQIADQEGFILIAPSGASGSAGAAWNVGTCCTSDLGVDDVAFVRAIINETKKVANIDESRIYATGFSMGGGMTHYLACHASDVIAAFAPEAFDLLQENVNQCKPSRAVPLLSQRASNDNLVKYDGVKDCLTGVCINFLGAVATNNVWKEKNMCTNQTSNVNGCEVSTQCTDGVEVGLCTTNSGHSPENSQRGWDFMKRFTLP